MGKPSAPPPPDYAGAAREQGVANQAAGRQTAVLNNPNIISPYGNQMVSYDTAGGFEGTPQPTITQSLTPDAQAALTAQQNVQRSVAELGMQGVKTAQDVMGKPFQYTGPQIQTSLGPQLAPQTSLDLSNVAKMPVNAGMTGQAAIMARLQPQIEQQTKATAQTLANQGITPGSEAYNNAMREQQQGQNDLLSQAALQGINLDMSANQQGYGQALGQAGFYNQGAAQGYNQALGGAEFGNQAAGQRLQQELGLYNVPLNQITALMSGSQIQAPQFQNYTGGGQIGAAPVAQAATNQGNYNTAAYNAKMNALSGLYQGIGSIAGSAASAGIAKSDIRLKSNIVKVGDHPKGFGIYEYDIDGHRERGVMAQEVEKIIPEAVMEHPDGYKMVNYGAL